MKKLIFTLNLLLLAVAAQAQYTKSIRLTTDDGSEKVINLSRSLVIKFDDDHLIANDGQSTVSVLLDKVGFAYDTSLWVSKPCDTNFDGTVDVADIATVISVMAAGASGSESKTADVNGDGTVDVADIATIISEMAAQARQQDIED